MRDRLRRTPASILACLVALAGAVAVLGTPAPPAHADDPSRAVTIAGTLDSELGCAGDWVTDCAASQLQRRDDGVYAATFRLPAGSYEFKIVVGGTWDENYGAGGEAGGANIPFTTDGGDVTFYFDPATHWATNTAIAPTATLVGDVQRQLGCPSDDDPQCMAGWLQDPDGDGILTYTTRAVTPGSYHVTVAENLGEDGTYGQGGTKDGPAISFTARAGRELQFRYVLATHALTVADVVPPAAGQGEQRAIWVDANTIAWPTSLLDAAEPTQTTWRLYASHDGGIAQSGTGVTGGRAIRLRYDPRGLTTEQLQRFPRLTGYLALHVTSLSKKATERILRGEVQVAQFDDAGIVALTGVQIPGVLDDLYARKASRSHLGVTWHGGKPSFAVWAPTAQRVDLVHYGRSGSAHDVRMRRTRDGRWVAHGKRSWKNTEYLYRVTVYVPDEGTVVTNLVTDPYSVALTVDSTRSVVADLDDPSLTPRHWARTPAPKIDKQVQRTIYELSVRDFSATDPSVPEQLRGTYDAFAVDGNGTKHLRALAKAGLNTVHLQPTFDFATVEEDRAKQRTTDCDLASYPPDSDQQQACVMATAGTDAYNWGYDPYHYFVPEGSYAVHPDGAARTREFRTMVGALHADGLQVVLDVVFNHTSASGQAATSVLDKIVPGYYHRLDASGEVETSTCCQDTASEHAMMQKLMVDAVVLWAKEYKVDGFRFDLMGFHSVENMRAVRAALDRLTLRKDGVDGKRIYLYGEGWNFGDVANNAYFRQAIQGQLGGTGIGTFNDRLRDAVRGGSPVDASTVLEQGFGSGLAGDPNGSAANGDTAQQAALLGHDADLIKIGLAGNLRDFTFTTSDGTVKRGDQIDYNGRPAGYAEQPGETINYVDAHDNQTLFDNLVMKLPQDAPMSVRIRLQTLSLATATLSQSPSLWLAGSDLMRSKSLDNNSYDSGDWFNAIDWSGQTNGFARGLPPKASNGSQWDLMRPRLARPAIDPSPADIATAAQQSQDLLRLKASTPLFSLGSAELIKQKVSFPVTGDPGVIAMRIDDTVGGNVDPRLRGALVIFNAGATAARTHLPDLDGQTYRLSPVQARGSDPIVKQTRWNKTTGTVTVPARTVAVLVSPQH